MKLWLCGVVLAALVVAAIVLQGGTQKRAGSHWQSPAPPAEVWHV
jgi:hypothetical protein